ncbi:Oidioi.mRNA.OKI2018_I69.chr1.g1278.t1.cds [Oikopleura dioica]|uniref:Oidioi.mRNA.OKI2018_I69.chr1.g1278.t1.cds n=1 Tax=Oikopleura dioica TaxID=34765 RepID=A0ABN7SME6_OIKDI|nr:Oidioi.mRNA.OKI2018_I69.chr1.g1278.t1.cds [Oikopleura dioica]
MTLKNRSFVFDRKFENVSAKESKISDCEKMKEKCDERDQKKLTWKKVNYFAPETFNAIKQNMQTATQAAGADMQNIGMSVDKNMVKTPARVLHAPDMHYGDGKQHPNNGT